ncbi:MAG: LacI family DNA-binding transcriptional regulator [Solirubrobacterales bacterium]|nr:LacI family DNA-binding transcriptional regulator [Solirubrobacterales bacterium]
MSASVSTVERALADDPRISAETKLRVRQAADEFGYVVNRARPCAGCRAPSSVWCCRTSATANAESVPCRTVRADRRRPA